MLPTLEKALAWPAEGGSMTQCVCWSENHGLMWLCALQLMREWRGFPAQDEHKPRLKFTLQQKIEHGHVELFSSAYVPFTFSAVANLCDFSNDAEAKELAQGAAMQLLQDLDLITNDKGFQLAVAGCNYKDYVESRAHQTRKMGWLLAGRGRELSAWEPFGQGPIALAMTTLGVSTVLENPVIQADIIRESGHNREEFHDEWSALNARDKQLVAMSVGGCAHPDCVVSLFSTLSYFNLWDDKHFKDLKCIRWLPPGALWLAANVASAHGSSALLHAQAALHKHKASMLSTLQDCHKGLNGEQQWPFVAAVGSAAAPLAAGDHQESRSPLACFPRTKQKENVALLVHSPNSDLQPLSRDNLDVTLTWRELPFSEDLLEQGSWIVGREGSSCVAVCCNCLDVNTDNFTSCSAIKQVWVCIVGHEDTHGSFEQLLTMLEAAQRNRVLEMGQFLRRLKQAEKQHPLNGAKKPMDQQNLC